MNLFDWVESRDTVVAEPVRAKQVVTDFDAMMRDYQLSAVVDTISRLDGGAKALLAVMATGLGKTQFFLEVARRYMDSSGRGVLILAHRDELLKQPRNRWQNFYGREMDIVSGGCSRFHRHTSVPTAASVQSLFREKRQRNEFPDPGEIGLIIIDEAHHCVQANKTYQAILDYFPHAQIVGVTATPNRSDEVSLARIFPECVVNLSLVWGIENGWLVPLQDTPIQISADFSAVGVRCGDVIPKEVDDAMNTEAVALEVAALLRDKCNGQTLYFAPGVETALRVADACTQMDGGVPVGVIASGKCHDPRPYVYSSSDKMRRGEFVRDFGTVFNHALNFGVLTEGFDAPATRFVVPRMTKSLPVLTQMIGRGTRVLPNVIEWQNGDGSWSRIGDALSRKSAIAQSAKPHCMVYDLHGNGLRHDVMSTVDALAGEFPDDVVHEVKQTQKSKGYTPKDLMQELLEAQERIEKREQERKRLEALKKVSVTAKYIELRPEDVMRAVGVTNIKRVPEYMRQAPTAQQIDRLLDLTNGMAKSPVMTREEALKLSRGQVGEAISKLVERKGKGLASPPQTRLLMKYGLSPDVSKATASATIDAIANNRWKLTESIIQAHERLVIKK